jgi:hypothetical protein
LPLPTPFAGFFAAVAKKSATHAPLGNFAVMTYLAVICMIA